MVIDDAQIEKGLLSTEVQIFRKDRTDVSDDLTDTEYVRRQNLKSFIGCMEASVLCININVRHNY